MESAAQIAKVASLLGDPARAAMLWHLIDGRAYPAGELAFVANVSAQSASGHLTKLVEAQLLHVENQGRHRYYRLASHFVGLALESLAAIAPRPPLRQLPASKTPPVAMRFARTCYDHLAGELAVGLLARLEEREWLRRNERDFEISPAGQHVFTRMGIDLQAARAAKRQFACGCLDWSERQFHLGGALGAALLQMMVKRKWVLAGKQARVLQLTPSGRNSLREIFGLEV